MRANQKRMISHDASLIESSEFNFLTGLISELSPLKIL
jgi:hypothetical protein